MCPWIPTTALSSTDGGGREPQYRRVQSFKLVASAQAGPAAARGRSLGSARTSKPSYNRTYHLSKRGTARPETKRRCCGHMKNIPALAFASRMALTAPTLPARFRCGFETIRPRCLTTVDAPLDAPFAPFRRRPTTTINPRTPHHHTGLSGSQSPLCRVISPGSQGVLARVGSRFISRCRSERCPDRGPGHNKGLKRDNHVLRAELQRSFLVSSTKRPASDEYCRLSAESRFYVVLESP